jgi:uncharacterized membrane protein
MTESEPSELFETDRLLAFSDAVFGVAITLLVIDLRLPLLPEGSGDSAWLQALRDMGPKLGVFAFTFLVVGTGWLGHHRKFSYIEKVDGRLLWVNLVYLLALCLVPFASSALGDATSRFAFALYAAVMAIVDLLSACLSACALREPFLGGRLKLTPALRLDMILAPLFAGAIFAIATAAALLAYVRAAHWVLFLIIPCMAFFGSRTRKAAAHRSP